MGLFPKPQATARGNAECVEALTEHLAVKIFRNKLSLLRHFSGIGNKLERAMQ